jgi:hypothetical protein
VTAAEWRNCTARTSMAWLTRRRAVLLQVKPSDMLAEMQGRLPIRVELKGLT